MRPAASANRLSKRGVSPGLAHTSFASVVVTLAPGPRSSMSGFRRIIWQPSGCTSVQEVGPDVTSGDAAPDEAPHRLAEEPPVYQGHCRLRLAPGPRRGPACARRDCFSLCCTARSELDQDPRRVERSIEGSARLPSFHEISISGTSPQACWKVFILFGFGEPSERNPALPGNRAPAARRARRSRPGSP